MPLLTALGPAKGLKTEVQISRSLLMILMITPPELLLYSITVKTNSTCKQYCQIKYS
jgi:hypothetical protein